MTNIEIILEMYENDGFRDAKFLKTYLNDNVELEWHSSKGLVLMNKKTMMQFAKELKANYSTSSTEIKYFFESGDTFSVVYNHYATTIENPKELILLGRFSVIWEFKNYKMVKGYIISQPN